LKSLFLLIVDVFLTPPRVVFVNIGMREYRAADYIFGLAMSKITSLCKNEKIKHINLKLLLGLAGVPVRGKVSSRAFRQDITLIQAPVKNYGVPGIVGHHSIRPPPKFPARSGRAAQAEQKP